MAKFGKFMLGFFIGAIIGGGASLLLAPYSGQKLQTEVNQYISKTTDDIRSAALQKREELEIQLETLRAPQKPDQNA